MSNEARIHEHSFVSDQHSIKCVICGIDYSDALPAKPVRIKGVAVRAAIVSSDKEKSEARWRDKIEDTLDKVKEEVSGLHYFTSAYFIMTLIFISVFHSCK